MIEHLACEKDVVWCIDSYFNREPTHLMMDAVENSVLWEIPRDIMEELSDANGDIAYLYRSFFRKFLNVITIKWLTFYVSNQQMTDTLDYSNIFLK